MRSADNVLRNIDGGAELLVDARPPGRFEGSAPEPRPGVAGGHVPGSVNVPFPVLLTKDGRCVWRLLREALGSANRSKPSDADPRCCVRLGRGRSALRSTGYIDTCTMVMRQSRC